MTKKHWKLSLIAMAVAAVVAGCGGGGDDPASPSTAAPAPTTNPSVPSVGTSSGTASDVDGTITPGLPPSPTVPSANQVAVSVPDATYDPLSQAFKTYTLIQDYRGRMRTEEESAFGVGLLAQRSELDTLAASFANSLPSDPEVQIGAAGYPISVTLNADTNNQYSIGSGDFCAKAIFSSLPGVELASSGMRYLGLSVPETAGTCVMIGALESADTWQLPPTGSSSVYPYPGKELTLTRFWGDYAALGFASQPGHAIFASVASVDALPFAVPGAGSGSPISPSAITLEEFTLVVRDTNAPVSARVLVPGGMQSGAGVAAEESSVFLFPTSMALIPVAPLEINTFYRATLRATVNGRPVSRTWEFTTSDS